MYRLFFRHAKTSEMVFLGDPTRLHTCKSRFSWVYEEEKAKTFQWQETATSLAKTLNKTRLEKFNSKQYVPRKGTVYVQECIDGAWHSITPEKQYLENVIVEAIESLPSI